MILKFKDLEISITLKYITIKKAQPVKRFWWSYIGFNQSKMWSLLSDNLNELGIGKYDPKELRNQAEKNLKKKPFSIVKLILLTVIGLAFFIAFFTLFPSPGQVTRTIDGDTLVISYQGKREQVRLLRINTPEQDQYGYKQATKALKELVGGRNVRLEFEEPERLECDVYRRILAYVWVDDLNVNVEMVRAGWSRFWTKYGAGKYADEFQTAENEAKEQGRGLWKRK